MKRILLAGAAVLAILGLLAAGWLAFALSGLPDISVLRHYRPAAASEVLDRNDIPIAHFYEQTVRIWSPIVSIPDIVVQAVVTAEDDTFFGHKGVNYKAVWEALQHDVRKKRFARGGSTITQQMIKNVLLSKEKTVKRKIREFVLARQAEDLLTKRQIMEIYLNEVEWGDRIHGIEAASRFYFDRHVGELSAAQAALLAGMLPNPKYYNPYKRPDKARQRQEQVLFNMFQAKLLTEGDYQAALQEPMKLREPSSTRFDFALLASGRRSCSQQALEHVLLDLYGDQALYRNGLRIRTTLDKGLQDSFAAALEQDSVRGMSEGLLVLREGGEIRALACGNNEEQARFFLNSLGAPAPTYELATVSANGFGQEHLVVPEVQSR